MKEETGVKCNIQRIERNQNKTLWTFYYLKRHHVALKNKQDPNEQYLFHGSRVDAYETICTKRSPITPFLLSLTHRSPPSFPGTFQ